MRCFRRHLTHWCVKCEIKYHLGSRLLPIYVWVCQSSHYVDKFVTLVDPLDFYGHCYLPFSLMNKEVIVCYV